MDFKYKIENGEVTITGYKDKLAGKINIPEFIEGYPVTKINPLGFNGCERLVSITVPNSIIDIDKGSLLDCNLLRVINGVFIIDSFCLINNRWAFHNNVIYKITYQVGGDYYCIYEYFNQYDDRFFINNRKYCGNFKYL